MLLLSLSFYLDPYNVRDPGSLYCSTFYCSVLMTLTSGWATCTDLDSCHVLLVFRKDFPGKKETLKMIISVNSTCILTPFLHNSTYLSLNGKGRSKMVDY